MKRTPPAAHAKHPKIDLHIRRQIVRGHWLPGRQLPTYDALEEQFNVSRATVMHAIKQLKDDGFVTSGGPRGVFVADDPPHTSNIGLVFPSAHRMRTEFAQSVVKQVERAFRKRPGRLYKYEAATPHSDDPVHQRMIADIEAHRVGGLILIMMGTEFMNTPVIKAPGVARVMISHEPSIPGVPTVYVDREGFRNRCLDYFAERGRKRLAVIVSAPRPDHESLVVLREAADARGLEMPEPLTQYVDTRTREWAAPLVQLLLSQTPAKRPDALLLTDDHYVPSVTAGFARLPDIKSGRDIDIASLSNFPLEFESDLDMLRVGFDLRELADVCIRQIESQHAGETPPQMTLLEACDTRTLDAS